MTQAAALYLSLAAGLFGLGLWGAVAHVAPLRRLLCVNVMGLGVFTALVARPAQDGAADPVAQALVITGLVVSVAATALGLALIRRAAAAEAAEGPADDSPIDGDADRGR